MTKFGTYQGSVGNKAGLAGHITYSGGFYNQDFFRNTSGFLSELERRWMELSFNASFMLMRENYAGAFFRPRIVDVEVLYPGLLKPDWGVGIRTVVENRLDSLITTGTVPIENRGGVGMWDYTAWHTTVSGDYQNKGEKANRENHYEHSDVSTSGFSNELPYTRDGNFNLPRASNGIERRFVGYG